MFGLGIGELIIIVVLVLIVFGAGKLPKVMDEVGKGVSTFRNSLEGKTEDKKDTDKE